MWGLLYGFWTLFRVQIHETTFVLMFLWIKSPNRVGNACVSTKIECGVWILITRVLSYLFKYTKNPGVQNHLIELQPTERLQKVLRQERREQEILEESAWVRMMSLAFVMIRLVLFSWLPGCLQFMNQIIVRDLIGFREVIGTWNASHRGSRRASLSEVPRHRTTLEPLYCTFSETFSPLLPFRKN